MIKEVICTFWVLDLTNIFCRKLSTTFNSFKFSFKWPDRATNASFPRERGTLYTRTRPRNEFGRVDFLLTTVAPVCVKHHLNDRSIVRETAVGRVRKPCRTEKRLNNYRPVNYNDRMDSRFQWFRKTRTTNEKGYRRRWRGSVTHAWRVSYNRREGGGRKLRPLSPPPWK